MEGRARPLARRGECRGAQGRGERGRRPRGGASACPQAADCPAVRRRMSVGLGPVPVPAPGVRRTTATPRALYLGTLAGKESYLWSQVGVCVSQTGPQLRPSRGTSARPSRPGVPKEGGRLPAASHGPAAGPRAKARLPGAPAQGGTMKTAGRGPMAGGWRPNRGGGGCGHCPWGSGWFTNNMGPLRPRWPVAVCGLGGGGELPWVSRLGEKV